MSVTASDIPQPGVGGWFLVRLVFKQVRRKSSLLLGWSLVRGGECGTVTGVGTGRTLLEPSSAASPNTAPTLPSLCIRSHGRPVPLARRLASWQRRGAAQELSLALLRAPRRVRQLCKRGLRHLSHLRVF